MTLSKLDVVLDAIAATGLVWIIGPLAAAGAQAPALGYARPDHY